MRNKIILFLLCSLFSLAASAEVKWTGWKKILSIQIVESGGLVLYFTTPVSTKCTSAGNSSLHIYAGQHHVTQEGLNAMVGAALSAHAADMYVNVLYDDFTEFCWGRYFIVSKTAY